MRRLTIRVSACTDAMGLLILMAWADGRLEYREKEGVRGAAEVLNLPAAVRERLEEQLARPGSLDSLDVDNLTTRERAFAFVSAAWMAHVVETLDPTEEELLGRIGPDGDEEPSGRLRIEEERDEERRDTPADRDVLAGVLAVAPRAPGEVALVGEIERAVEDGDA